MTFFYRRPLPKIAPTRVSGNCRRPRERQNGIFGGALQEYGASARFQGRGTSRLGRPNKKRPRKVRPTSNLENVVASLLALNLREGRVGNARSSPNGPGGTGRVAGAQNGFETTSDEYDVITEIFFIPNTYRIIRNPFNGDNDE